MELVHQLERLGYRLKVKIAFEYVKPDTRPPTEEAARLLRELSQHREEVILFLADRSFRPQRIRLSEKHRIDINKSKTVNEAFGHALAAIYAMTGDQVGYEQNCKRWLESNGQ